MGFRTTNLNWCVLIALLDVTRTIIAVTGYPSMRLSLHGYANDLEFFNRTRPWIETT
jgi:3'-phosphoadenosine 5'-phosphosulfate (PAPS) 3'-phosphatase